MHLAPGHRLGSFEIVSLVGEGGMGQVYRARDTKLGRDVAIKILPDTFARDADRLARFRREAQALAALNDPHIAQIFHLEDVGQSVALVMEFVEGRTLAEAISARALDQDEALRLAAEIAAGLETAHEKGIIHRDLKPANVKITRDGHAKILDFGLAKAMAGDAGSAELMNSPTLTARATEAGMILGTAAYMSPEQARGKTVDKRTDIWAFGAVLFEMLTGRRAFDGETVSDTLASVLRSDPDWSLVPASVPPHARALLGRCLDRDAARRLRDIGEARLALSGATSSSASIAQPLSSMTLPPAAAPAPSRRPWPWIIATAVMAVAFAALVPTSSLFRPSASVAPADSLELAIAAPFGAEFQIGSNSGNVALSPDGSRITFVAAAQKATTIWVRSLAVDDARPLSGTDAASNLFWSPDGRRIGFFAAGKLRTVDIAGGLPEAIADAPNGRGGAWSEDGTIIFTPNGGQPLFKVRSSGGTVTPLTTLDASRGENAHYWPAFLPGGQRFLYFARSTQVENSGIYLGHMDGSPSVRLVASLSSGLISTRPGSDEAYLLWARDNDLLAQPFDLASGTLSGEVTKIAGGVRVEESQRLTYASASRNGHLAWATARAAESALAVYARDGRRLRVLDIPAGVLHQPALSPDGTRVLFIRVERGSADIFMHDLRSGITERLTTSPEYDELPVWTPDGRAVTYLGREQGQRVGFRVAVGGAAPVKQFVSEFSLSGLETPDGRYLIVSQAGAASGLDVMALELTGERKTIPLLQQPGEDIAFAQSVDGRWILMMHQTGERNSVSIARLRTDGPTPVLGARQILSEALGATMRPDGREVFVTTPDGTVKVISLNPAGDAMTVGATTVLFRLPPGTVAANVNPAGTEFILEETPFAAGQTLRALTRWEARLKSR
ncbi:MAG TPA: protein kinase [Vicinamibacterales bacterium]|nr:protein kinase [Vicinamibacterales bacterium]